MLFGPGKSPFGDIFDPDPLPQHLRTLRCVANRVLVKIGAPEIATTDKYMVFATAKGRAVDYVVNFLTTQFAPLALGNHRVWKTAETWALKRELSDPWVEDFEVLLSIAAD